MDSRTLLSYKAEMNWIFFGLPVALGVATILQGGLNRRISLAWGLPATVVMNSLVFLLVSVLAYVFVRAVPGWFPDAFWRPSGPSGTRPIALWYLIPGIMGFVIVAGLPYGIARIGALQVIVGFVATQLVGGLLWDFWVEGIPITAYRIGGAALAVMGTLLAMKS